MDESKVAIICGMGGALDAILAKTLMDNGINVEMIEHRADSMIVDSTGVAGGRFSVDLTNEEEIQAAIGQIIVRRGKVDYLINCPDLRLNSSLDELDGKAWDDSISFNLTSVFLTCKHVVPTMIAQGKGRIINLSSDAAHVGAQNGAAYAAAKAGVIAFSKVLVREVGSKGITVNTVSAGLIGEDLLPFRNDLGVNSIPLGRSGRWEDVANAVLCLLDERLSYLTGQTVHVNGGLLML